MRALFLIVAMLALSCGQTAQPIVSTPPDVMPAPVPAPENPPTPEPEKKKVILAVWGAPWCSVCKHVLPDVERELDALDKQTRDAIDFRLYVPTGNASNSQPTDAVALQYKAQLGLSAVAYVDPWRWKLFKHWIGTSNAIPAGALIDVDGKLIRRFAPGSLDPVDIVFYASEQVK